MSTDKVVSALKRQKELLESLLDLAECQMELLDEARLEDLQVLLSLRSDPSAELAIVDSTVEQEMSQVRNDLTVTAEQLDEIHALNLDIIRLTDMIVNLDETAESLASQYDEAAIAPLPGSEALPKGRSQF